MVIPQTVSTIAAGAFDQLDEVRAVTLPAGIQTVEKNAFSGVRDGSIIYIYDAGTEASKTYGKQLAEEYEQLVYSEYLDAEKTEQIAGIQNLSDMPEDISKEDTSKENVSEEAPEVKEGAGNTADKTESGLEASQPEESESESKPTESESESKPTESESESQPEESSEPESSSVIVIEPDQKYTVTFDTGISGVAGRNGRYKAGAQYPNWCL